MGVLITYDAYVPARENLPRAALSLVIGDTLIALLAGLMIFPAVFTYGVDPAQGPTLAFAALPEVFQAMPGGRGIAIAFFLLLFIAALTSSVALLEVPVAWVITRWKWHRARATLVVGAFALALGVPVALGYGVLAPAEAGAETLLERIDHFSSNILLPASGIAVAMMAGWVWHPDVARHAANLAVGAVGLALEPSRRAAAGYRTGHGPRSGLAMNS